MKKTILFFIIFAGENFLLAYNKHPIKLTFNLGSGFYKTDFALIATSLIPINSEELQEFIIQSNFVTQRRSFPFFVGDLFIKCTKYCNIIASFSGGKLHKGFGLFEDRIKGTDTILAHDSVDFNASFLGCLFNIEFDVKLHSFFSLKPKAGFSVDFVSIITSAPKTFIKYHIDGPLIGLKIENTYTPLLLSANYSVTFAKLKKRAIDTIKQETIYIEFPKGFLQQLTISGEYQFNNHIILGLRMGFTRYDNYGTGTAVPISNMNEKINPYALFNKTNTFNILASFGYIF